MLSTTPIQIQIILTATRKVTNEIVKSARKRKIRERKLGCAFFEFDSCFNADIFLYCSRLFILFDGRVIYIRSWFEFTPSFDSVPSLCLRQVMSTLRRSLVQTGKVFTIFTTYTVHFSRISLPATTLTWTQCGRRPGSRLRHI